MYISIWHLLGKVQDFYKCNESEIMYVEFYNNYLKSKTAQFRFFLKIILN